ncbi:hypothetical protein BV898_02742 [Hypsibius exemplaris]|uniref:Peptidase S1 domain-containing protein n=1 Tax=Hypsibius exemplaris TaxID=2072580 RepID=A0A1W0X710_HYPEX|nr:hypothetical protein BV898_02742 [Hypsibius exemplaris]
MSFLFVNAVILLALYLHAYGVTGSYGSGSVASSIKKCGFPGAGSNADLFSKTARKSLRNLVHQVGASAPQNGSLSRFHRERIEGKKFSVSPTIVGGSRAVLNQLCWQVTIRFDAGTFYYECGGVIVGPQTVLSAANCYVDQGTHAPKQNITVVVGLINSDTFNITASGACAESYNVSQLILYPDFSPFNFTRDDIAVIKLDRAIDLDGKPCACRACLEDLAPKPGDLCIASGIGLESTEDTNPVSPLKWVPQAVLENTQDKCFWLIEGDLGEVGDSTTTEPISPVINNFTVGSICAGGVVGEDICFGDGGSALMCLDENEVAYVAGIASTGTAECGVGIGSQYTKIKDYFQWIRQIALPEDVL